MARTDRFLCPARRHSHRRKKLLAVFEARQRREQLLQIFPARSDGTVRERGSACGGSGAARLGGQHLRHILLDQKDALCTRVALLGQGADLNVVYRRHGRLRGGEKEGQHQKKD